MIDLLLVFVGIIALLIGSYTDIQKREVPDSVSYGLIVCGLLLRLLIAIFSGKWIDFGYELGWFILFVAIAFLMFYTGQWGGADSKLLMGLGIVFASYPWSLRTYTGVIPNLSIPFPVTLLFHIFLFGAIYGIIWSLVLAFRGWKSFRETYFRLSKEKTISNRIRKLALMCSFIFLFSGLVSMQYDSKIFLLLLSLFVISFALLLFLHSLIFAKAVEISCMIKTIPVNKLTEGDWIVEEVKAKGKYICGPKDLGISMAQINLLKKNRIKEVLVKEGIPFVPAFLVALIVSLIFGNILFVF